jgi:molybdenum cofactor biosynthesis protein B
VSQQDHKAAAPASVLCAIVTISDTRTEATDASGRAMADLLSAAGHVVAARAIVPDDPDTVVALVRRHVDDPGVQAVLTTGGTGITSRDSTFEALDGLFEKRLPGFGELFRMLSFHDIGPAAMLSRAAAGTIKGRIVLSLPGSEAAVRLALTRLVIPELAHLVQQATRGSSRADDATRPGPGPKAAS